MRPRPLTLSALTALGLVAAVPPIAAAQGPSAKAIARAIARAERSKDLWATVNICQSRGASGGDLGIRGEMPALGFPAQLRMTVQLNRATASGAFIALPGATSRAALDVGRFSSGLQQDGAVFPFGARAGLLNATVTFTWSRSGRVLGSVARTTTGGHPTVAFGKPPHHSAATCRL